MTFSLKGLKTITNYQYEPACGILSLLDIFRRFVYCTRKDFSSVHPQGSMFQLQCRSPGRWDLDTPLLRVCVTPARYVSLNVAFAYDRTLANIRKEILMFQ